MKFCECWLSIHKISSVFVYIIYIYKFIFQAVPYSREFKQKYDYFRKKLKKPVSNMSSKNAVLVLCK